MKWYLYVNHHGQVKTMTVRNDPRMKLMGYDFLGIQQPQILNEDGSEKVYDVNGVEIV